MFKFTSRIVMLVLCCLLLMGTGVQMLSGQAQGEKKGFDIIIRNGTIIDGSGLSQYDADVGIRNGYIARIGNLDDYTAIKEIDVQGLFVAPGFIDNHSHASTSALQKAKNSLTQGVTTEILNPDGGGPIDLEKRFNLEERGLGINIGTYIGFNSVWETIVGYNDRRATPEEISDMQNIVKMAMKDGAFGVSSGLYYTPGYYAGTDQVIDVVKVAKDWRTNFPTHLRNENNKVIEATAEAIEIGEKAGLVPVITHMKVMGPNNWGKSKKTIELMKEANDRGTYVAADVYPYLRSQTGLYAMVPPWVKEGGNEEMLKRFADPELRPQIENEIEEVMHSRVEDANGVYFPSKRKTLADYMEEWDVSPGEATMLIFETIGSLRTIYHFGKMDDFKRILQNQTTAIASDGGATTSDSQHPRRYGSFPRVLGKFVREDGLLEWEGAIRKMTGLPATIIGMTERGFIAEGMVADITIFDPETVIDKATFDNPKQYAKGIKYVIVNGELALVEGELTKVQAGKALMRAPNMPSRPMNPHKAIQIDGKGELFPIESPNSGSGMQIDYSVDQGPDARKAEGDFNISSSSSGVDFQSKELGKLQITDDWASFTGRGTINGSEERTFRVIVDENEPSIKDVRPTVTIHIEGMDEIRGFLGQPKPLQHETDFSEYDVGGSPDDWSSLWGESSWTVLDNPYRLRLEMPDASGIRRSALTWDEVGKIRGDVTISAVVRAHNTRKSKFQLGFHMSEADRKTFYYLELFGSNPTKIRINRFLNGNFTVLGSEELPFKFEEDNWYQVVVQREGDKIQAKVWPYGVNEPDEWLVTVKDSFLQGGLLGLIHLTPEVVNEWAFFGVGTSGEPAPRAPVDLLEKLSATVMIASIEQFEEEGEFANHGAARSLQVHLKAVDRFEKKGQAEKVIKHMEGFKRLLDHQKDYELISEKAYNSLYSDAESLILNWQ